MTYRFTLFCLCIFLFSGFILAQENSLSEISDKTPNLNISTRAVLLWDNMLPPAASGIVSSRWGGKTPPNDVTQCAEDFTVPGGILHWNVNEIVFTGFYSTGTLPASEFQISFYENNGGVPGNLIATRSIAPVPDPVQGTFANVTLTPGTYWVSIYAFHDTATVLGTFRWNWYASESPEIGSEPYLRDMAGFFGGIPWTSFTALGLPQFNGLLFSLYGDVIVPVELTSFAASSVDGNVTLNWATASELNNRGFEVQKMLDNEFHTIGFVNGNGTTTEIQTYSYIDKNVPHGAYSYRLKQIDYDGSFEYSDVVEVDVNAPVSFNLGQNYPNPFNPSTTINFGLASDSKVTLKIFNLLGQEVAVPLNGGNLNAGVHNIDFNASNLNSGVYFYSLEAAGVDGTNFTSTRKMILTK